MSATGQALPRQIKIIIPFAEKSPSDVVIRSLVPILAKSVNREIVVENLIDVQGEKVAQLLAESPKDGSVLLISPFAASARRLRSNDNRIVPVGIVADTPLSIVVREGVTARDLPELFASSRLAGRRLRMTVPLKGSPSEMCALQLQSKFGADVIELVSFNGEAAAFTEVANGNADLTCGNTASMRGATSQPNSKVRELAEIRSTSSPLAQQNRAAVSGARDSISSRRTGLGFMLPPVSAPIASRCCRRLWYACRAIPLSFKRFRGCMLYPSRRISRRRKACCSHYDWRFHCKNR